MTILTIIMIAVLALGAMIVCIGGTDVVGYLVYRNAERVGERDTARKNATDAGNTIAFGLCLILAASAVLAAIAQANA